MFYGFHVHYTSIMLKQYQLAHLDGFIDTFFCKIYITILLVQVLINQSIWGSRVTKKNTKPCSLVYTTPQSPDTFMNNACYD